MNQQEYSLRQIVSLMEQNDDLKDTLIHEILKTMLEGDFVELTEGSLPNAGNGTKVEIVGHLNDFEKAIHTLNKTFQKKSLKIAEIVDTITLSPDLTQNELRERRKKLECCRRRLSQLYSFCKILDDLLKVNIYERFCNLHKDSIIQELITRGSTIFLFSRNVHEEFGKACLQAASELEEEP